MQGKHTDPGTVPVPVDNGALVPLRDDDEDDEDDAVDSTVDEDDGDNAVDSTVDDTEVEDCGDAEGGGKDVVGAGRDDTDEGVLTDDAPDPAAKLLPIEVKVVHKDEEGIG